MLDDNTARHFAIRHLPDEIEALIAALRRDQTAPPVLIRLVPDATPLPRRTPARIPGQRRGEAR
ncbi:hypothetical protein TH66_00800 [Carbonactinospora thermoautotrophica]|uniref:Uncharacterized protein n=1 Tax=Carbonactinospora thermoautotrophica TaxID=1469144 RepID=A0A132NGU4_9ACTN|nr:hypothetical protein [Carbonactinospora thermoautotrophica]KWX03186.1 hypothetical protein LI90_4237 [Carbonactinospora thermoautotrophica]KWX03261.1 hypothetical protein LI90_4312 [Carbonactinospora thermoautotrophica]KWX05895.1 hypothetical protein TH66_00800 [Carbonactinospora thermoautotrophica]KWX09216.1 hypothetical protein TR74_10960 [Carbonactinospora thermoautotrophica]